MAKPPRFVAMGDPWISPINGYIYINGAVNGVCSGDSLVFYLVSPMMNPSPFTQFYLFFVGTIPNIPLNIATLLWMLLGWWFPAWNDDPS